MIVNVDLISTGVAMVKQELSKGVVEVTFTKSDGNVRVMFCTTLGNLIPEEKKPKKKELAVTFQDMDIMESGYRMRPAQLITAFDVEKQDWRSFNYTTITGIKLHAQPLQA